MYNINSIIKLIIIIIAIKNNNNQSMLLCSVMRHVLLALSSKDVDVILSVARRRSTVCVT